MVLGSILKEPHDLESSLNFGSIEAFKDDERLEQTPEVRRLIDTSLRMDQSGQLKASLPMLSPKISGGADLRAASAESIQATMAASNVRAEVIMPDTAIAHVKKALDENEKIWKHVQSGGLTNYNPLYIIVGVATCKRLVQKESRTREGNLEIEPSGNFALAGAEIATQAAAGSKGGDDIKVKIEEECAFAYRLREFQYSKLPWKDAQSSDYLKGAAYGRDDGESMEAEAELPNKHKLVFDKFESDDEEVSVTQGGVNLDVSD